MKYILFLSFILFTGCSNHIENIKVPDQVIKDVEPVQTDLNISKIPPKPQSNIVRTLSFFKNLEQNCEIAKNEPLSFKINDLNNFFNKNFTYKGDKEVYKKDDYWASIHEMMQSGFVGDCEDFTFAKIQVAEMYGINKQDIFIGYTAEGKHIFPIFFDGERLNISDTKGRLRTFNEYLKQYPDMKIYAYDEIWLTKDAVFSNRKVNKTLFKITGKN